MQLEQLVPSLELCKELKENGYPQDTLFIHYENDGKSTVFEQDREFATMFEKTFAAPTASEIWEHIPHKLQDIYYCEMTKRNNYCAIFFMDRVKNESLVGAQAPREELPTLLAKIWLTLKKMNLLSNHSTTDQKEEA